MVVEGGGIKGINGNGTNTIKIKKINMPLDTQDQK